VRRLVSHFGHPDGVDTRIEAVERGGVEIELVTQDHDQGAQLSHAAGADFGIAPGLYESWPRDENEAGGNITQRFHALTQVQPVPISDQRTEESIGSIFDILRPGHPEQTRDVGADPKRGEMVAEASAQLRLQPRPK